MTNNTSKIDQNDVSFIIVDNTGVHIYTKKSGTGSTITAPKGNLIVRINDTEERI